MTLSQYESMVDAGVFSGERKQRLELIHGELRQMNPIGSPHAHAVDVLMEWSFEVVPGSEVRVRCQAPLRIPVSNSSPEPDLMWLVRKDYSAQHPNPSDVLLLIEVAEDSLRFDLGEKARLYAEAGIKDYWVVDIARRAIHIHRQPQSGGYGSVTIVPADQAAQSLHFPTAKLLPQRLFS